MMPGKVVVVYVRFVVKFWCREWENYENGIGGTKVGESVTLGMSPKASGIVGGRIILKRSGKRFLCLKK